MGMSYGFQSTRPMRGATWASWSLRLVLAVSIHAPHAGRDVYTYVEAYSRSVSIHAPHAGRDGKRGYDFPLLPHIYGYYAPQI